MTYDWDFLKPEIYKLYLIKNYTLEQVRRTIGDQFGVMIQNRTYREKLKEWGYRKVDQKGRHRGGVSSRTYDLDYASTIDSPGSPDPSSPRPTGPGNRSSEMLVLPTHRSQWDIDTDVLGRPVSAMPDIETLEPEPSRWGLEKDICFPAETAMIGAEAMSEANPRECDPTLTQERQLLGPQLVTAPPRMMPQDNSASILWRRTDPNDSMFRTTRSLYGPRPMADIPLGSASASLTQMSTCYECSFNSMNWESGRCVRCQNKIHAKSSLTSQMPNPGATGLILPVTSNHENVVATMRYTPVPQQIPVSLIKETSDSHIQRQAEENYHATGPQIPVSDYNPLRPNLTSDVESKANYCFPHKFVEKKPPCSTFQGAQTLPTETSAFNMIGSQPQSVSLPTQATGAFPHYPQLQDTNNQSKEMTESFWHEENFDMAQDTIMAPPEARSYTFPLQDRLNNPIDLDETYLPAWSGDLDEPSSMGDFGGTE